MKLSIVIPIYNSEIYLKRCINSLIVYKNLNIEIILIDDGSTDNSLKICRSYEKKFKNIKVIHKKNEGQGIARNVGIDTATGDYITFVDSDDYFDNSDNNDLNFMIEYINNHNSDFYIANWKNIYITKEDINYRKNHEEIYYKKEENFKDFIDNMIWPDRFNSYGSAVWSKFYNLNIIKENNIRFYSERKYFSEDLIFNLQYIQYIKSVIVVDKPIYCYFQNSASYKNKYHYDYLEKLNNMYVFFKENLYFFNKYKKNIYIRMFSYLKSCILNEIMHFNIFKASKNIKNICKKRYIKEIINNCKSNAKMIDKVIILLIKLKLYFLIVLIYKIYKK